MIKQIQLRGISRTPSDRMTADGGCAESLNVHLEEGETTPTLPPKDVCANFGYVESSRMRPVFIHKTSRRENLILLDVLNEERNFTGNLYYAVPGGEPGLVMRLEAYERPISYSSIGNILVVTTAMQTHYARWNEVEEEYKDLGTRIPEPVIEFIDRAAGVSDDVDVSRTVMNVKRDPLISMEAKWWINFAILGYSELANAVKYLFEDEDKRKASDALKLDEATWNAALSGIVNDSVDDSDNNTVVVATIVNAIWDSVRVLISNNRAKGFFSTPLFARYAVKLYDGSYIYQSTPFLLGGYGAAYLRDRTVTMTYEEDHSAMMGSDVDTKWEFDAKVQFERKALHATRAVLVDSAGIEDWKELIQSIDLFISPDIYVPPLTSKFTSLERTQEGIGNADPNIPQGASVESRYDHWVNTGILSLEAPLPDEEERAVTAIGNFYRIASFTLEELGKLQEGYNIKPLSQDKLLTLPTLLDDQLSHHDVIASKGTMTYNNRLLNIGATVKLYPGPKTWPSLYRDGRNAIPSSGSYAIVYEVLDEDGNPHSLYGPVHHKGSLAGCSAYAWIAYPDTRCRRARLVRSQGSQFSVYTFPMKEHPLLNLSYAFIGFGEDLMGAEHVEVLNVNPVNGLDNAKAVYTDNRKLMLSEFKNPFIFPIKHRESMPAELIGVAAITRALSIGQVGQFDLYVFTTEGIFVIPITKEGTFAGVDMPDMIAREIAYEGTITPIEQAIIFVTDRGVMMISASDVTELSPNMNGRHYTLNTEVAELIALRDDGWKDLLPAMQDATPFMAFMKEATIIYDYAGKRLLCFNKSIPYQYVYMLPTSTWHKTYEPGLEFYCKLNSYPGALASMLTEDGLSTIRDYSTFLDEQYDEEDYVRSVIVTRPMDFDASDVRKSLNALRHRGFFNKGDVKYIVLGSMDGHKWGRLKTLRGGSYKLFRLVILTRLSPTERLSWIDADVEVRFPNKLR